jgi:oxygen-independent coproporphyrinogen-3 oxidase
MTNHEPRTTNDEGRATNDQRRTRAETTALGLYVHVPFCAAICNYCNFNRGLFDAELKARYVRAVLQEIASASDGSPADTIFFGGGTPSLLEPAEIGDIIDACRTSFALAPHAEITLEANPETVTVERLSGFRAAGVNRLSYGVQSFNDAELQRLSRLHTASRAEIAVTEARTAGFDNVSLDLMMWLPQQDVATWLRSVDKLIAVGPEHASLYMLEVYPNAPLKEEMARARWSQAPDDDVAEMYLEAMARLEGAGYGQYEISNVARPGRESRHNLKYWQDGEWRGFGPGAHSTRNSVRWKNVSSTEEYVSSVSKGIRLIVEERRLSQEERLEEALFTGLRLADGVNLFTIRERYGVDVWAKYGRDLRSFAHEGLLVYDGATIRLTRRGMLLAHEIMTVFISSAVR